MTTAGAPERRPGGLASEGTRFTVAVGVAVVGALPVPFLVLGSAVQTGADAFTAFIVGFMAGIDLMCATYIVLTVRAFRGVSTAELPDLVRPRPVALWIRILRGGDDGPAAAVQFAVIALFAAAVLPRLDQFVPEGRPRATLVVLAVAGVLLCWAVLTLSYAVHYARVHLGDGGLAFPGATGPTFGDYVYFAVAVSTTLGTTDVVVDGRRMRRVVTGHALLAFAFNTVILALVLSALAA